MPNITTCPACRQACTVADDLVGKRIRCPHCQLPFLVALDVQDVTSPPGGGVQAAAPPPPPLVPPAPLPAPKLPSPSRSVARSRALIPPPPGQTDADVARQAKPAPGFIFREMQMGLVYIGLMGLLSCCIGSFW